MMDVDGVLLGGRPADGLPYTTDLQRDLGISPTRLQAEFFGPQWQSIITGRRDLKPALETALKVMGSSVAAEQLIAYWFENDSRIDRDVLTAVRQYRASGGKVFLATNQEHLRARYILDDLGLRADVDGIIYSAAVGHRKPAPEFFELAAGAAGHDGDILLVDDTLENVEAALAFGWQATHWQGGMSMTDVLGRAG
jgi:putative hydrolase of the HAD superfamily